MARRTIITLIVCLGCTAYPKFEQPPRPCWRFAAIVHIETNGTQFRVIDTTKFYTIHKTLKEAIYQRDVRILGMCRKEMDRIEAIERQNKGEWRGIPNLTQ